VATNTPQQGAQREGTGARLAFGWRFNPQVLVFVIGLGFAWFPIVGLVETGIHLLWGSSFRQVDYTMLEARPNDGSPYITGTLTATGETFLIATRQTGDRFLVGLSGDDPFVPGKVVKLWWSPSSPDLLIEGRRTNGVPVSAMPERPGVLAFLGYALWLAAVVGVAARLFRWAWSKSSRGIAERKLSA
jgi:hypothetical protein